MSYFLSKAGLDFFIAFGIVIGGSMLAGVGSVFMLLPPATVMLDTAARLKIWAIVAAIGGFGAVLELEVLRVCGTLAGEGHAGFYPSIGGKSRVLTAPCGAPGRRRGRRGSKPVVP